MDRPPPLNLLGTFVEIFRSGSLTAAAARLGLTQPALSGQLMRLEVGLGESLFTRSRSGVQPTARAVLLMAQVSPHVDVLRTATARHGLETAPLGVLKLGGAADFVSARVLPALAPLVGQGPDLRVTTGLAADLIDALAAGELDLVVASVRIRRAGMDFVALTDEEFVLVGSPGLSRTVDQTRLSEDPAVALGHLPVVAFADDQPIVRRYWRTEFGRRPTNRVAVVMPDLRGVLAAVIAGAGISVLPRYLADAALDAGSVELLHEPHTGPLNTLYLATRRGSLAEPAVARVQERLLDRASSWERL